VPPEGRSAAVVMLDIDGVRVLEARHVDGEVELTVETTTDRGLVSRVWSARAQ
jgi:hypothetical protein